jgi:hypothetical protein
MNSKIPALCISFGLVTGLFALTSSGNAAKETAENFAKAPCSDSEGATTGFFCQPLSAKGKLVPACDVKKPKDLASCQAQGATDYCGKRGYSRHLSYSTDGKGNLAELVCSRAPVTAVAAVEEWQPMFDVNLMGYDRREFPLSRPDDWQTCRAACDADGGCQAWTVSREARMCYLKWDGNAELLSYNNCCITGTKGMASAGSAVQQRSRPRTPEELKRLGRRVQGAAEDEVGRRAEDAVRRGIGDIIN